MKQNWPLIGAVVAVLAIPFGLAAFEDATSEPEGSDIDDFRELEALTELVEPEPEPEPEAPQGQAIAEWERTEPVGFSFLDPHLDPGKSRLRGELATVLESDDRAELVGRLIEFNREHAALQVSAELVGHSSAPVVVFYFPNSEALRPILERRWGTPAFVRADGAAIAWVDEDSGSRAVLRVNRGLARRSEAPGGVLERQHVEDRRGELAVGPFVSLESVTEHLFGEVPRNVAEAEAAFPGQLEKSETGFTLYLPALDAASEYETRIYYELGDAGSLVRVAADLNLSLDEAGLKAILAYLKRRFGSMRRTELDTGASFRFKRRGALQVIWREFMKEVSIAMPVTRR